METRAILRGVRLSDQKGRLVADQIRGGIVVENDPAASDACGHAHRQNEDQNRDAQT